MSRIFLLTMLALLSLSGCSEETPQVLGTLEYDRIALPAPSAERIGALQATNSTSVPTSA